MKYVLPSNRKWSESDVYNKFPTLLTPLWNCSLSRRCQYNDPYCYSYWDSMVAHFKKAVQTENLQLDLFNLIQAHPKSYSQFQRQKNIKTYGKGHHHPGLCLVLDNFTISCCRNECGCANWSWMKVILTTFAKMFNSRCARIIFCIHSIISTALLPNATATEELSSFVIRNGL